MSGFDFLQATQEFLLNHGPALVGLGLIGYSAYRDGKSNGLKDASLNIEQPPIHYIPSKGVAINLDSLPRLVKSGLIGFISNGAKWQEVSQQTGYVGSQDFSVNSETIFEFNPLSAITGEPKSGAFSLIYMITLATLSRQFYDLGYRKGHNSVTQAETL